MSPAEVLREICDECRGQGLAAIGVELLRCRVNERLAEAERLSYFAFAALLGLEGYTALRRKGHPVTVDLRQEPETEPEPTPEPEPEPHDVPAQEQPEATAAEEWRPIEYMPGYEINRAGQVRDASGRTLAWSYKKNPATKNPLPFVQSSRLKRAAQVNVLLEQAFGPGAAVAAGLSKPDLLRAQRSRSTWAANNASKPRQGRVCHDCGKPTPNYRCEACWRARRGYGYADAPAVGLDCL